jgi:hypothetical protein
MTMYTFEYDRIICVESFSAPVKARKLFHKTKISKYAPRHEEYDTAERHT